METEAAHSAAAQAFCTMKAPREETSEQLWLIGRTSLPSDSGQLAGLPCHQTLAGQEKGVGVTGSSKKTGQFEPDWVEVEALPWAPTGASAPDRQRQNRTWSACLLGLSCFIS